MVPDSLSMIVVMVRNYRNYRFPYLYTCAGLLMAAVVVDAGALILYNWGVGCGTYYLLNDKCNG